MRKSAGESGSRLAPRARECVSDAIADEMSAAVDVSSGVAARPHPANADSSIYSEYDALSYMYM